jgi:Spy/CpxP family protein refolding chaperone
MTRRIATALVLLMALPAWGRAQTPPPDPVGQALFPPEIVMQHQQALGITANQRAAITAAIQKTQNRMLEVQWDMQSATQKLAELLGATPVDETAALAQVDRVLNLERGVKRAQLSLMIRIKNALTREQQAKLKVLRSADSH